MYWQIFFYFFAFVVIWYAAGMVVAGVDRLSHRLNISSFAVSFFILGILTSAPEMAIGINSVLDKNPAIFVGNLIGGILVLFLLAIPVLAIFGGGVKLAHQLESKSLIFALMVVAAPSFFILDGKATLGEALFLIFLYGVLFYLVEKRKGLLERIKDKIFHQGNHVIVEAVKVVCGVLFIFLASKYIVDTTIFFSAKFNISSFLISLILIALGTNLPELSLAIRSLVERKKEVALGDYIGSAAANSLIFGILVILSGGQVAVVDNFWRTFVFVAAGLGAFFYFSRSKKDISQGEGLALIGLYFLFLIFEIM